MEHTPGPWEADGCTDEGHHYYQIDAPTPRLLNSHIPYRVADTLNRHHCISPEEDAANARVMAAAPDLLEALKEVVALSDREHNAWDKARAAIARAEGRS